MAATGSTGPKSPRVRITYVGICNDFQNLERKQDMVYFHRRSFVIGLAVLILALAGGTVFAATQVFSGVATVPSSLTAATPTIIQGTLPGVGAMETTDEGLTVTLTQLVKNGPRWLFHFQLKNAANTTLTVRGTSDVHQFVLAGVIQTPPYSASVPLSSPSTSEIAANYPDLATILPSGGTAQGWLAVDTTNLGFTPSELLYRYATVQALGCTDPSDPSTCHTDTLYQALTWYFLS